MKRLFLILLFLLLSVPCFSATYYMATDGSDSNTGVTDSRWKTFSHAFGEMSAGDTLILGDGTYDSDNGGIDYLNANDGMPPDGTNKTTMTTVQSESGVGTVIVQNRLFLGRSDDKLSYVKIQGIEFQGLSQLFNTSYCYIKECFFTAFTRSTAACFAVGTVDHSNGNTYNLIEDCWVDGEQRIGMINYNAHHNVWRRCVIRLNGSDYSSGNPVVGFTIYSSEGVSAQNMIVIDKLSDAGVDGQDFAGVQADPADDFGQNEYLGCITIDAEENGWMIEPEGVLTEDDYTFRLENCLAINSTSYGIGIQGTGVQHDVLIDHCTTISCGATGIRAIPTTENGTSLTAKNNLSESNLYGIYIAGYTSITSEYNQAYDNTNGTFTPSGSNNSATDSQMLYAIQPGAGAITGNDTKQVGADITKRYGTDGYFADDSGYNTLSETDLWPWPNEAQIKSDFASNSTRGFCATTANPRTDTGVITLTSYIWEYLGNEIPGDIYGVGSSSPTIQGVSLSGNN